MNTDEETMGQEKDN